MEGFPAEDLDQGIAKNGEAHDMEDAPSDEDVRAQKIGEKEGAEGEKKGPKAEDERPFQIVS